MSFTIGSLFDGSGGFPLAATMCGGTPKWASEVEPFPIAVTWSRFTKMKHLGSVTDIKGGEVEPVDVITFGSPCQDLSVAGKRAGLKHEANGDDETTRSGLFMEAVRIIKEMREATNGVYPRFALWENVPGAFSSNRGEDFRIVLEELIKIAEPSAVMPEVPKNGWPYADSYCGDGWSIAYRVLDAQFWGVPQRRRRIYLVADFRGECAGKVSFEREGLRGYFETGRTPWKAVAGDVESGVGTADCTGNCVGLTNRGFFSGAIAETLRAESHGALPMVAYALDQQGGKGGANYAENVMPTLCSDSHGTPHAVAYPSWVLDEQGGSQISVHDDGKCPTLRAETHGNLPCVLSIENHPADSRVDIDDSGKVQTLTSRMGTGGGNVPMVMEPVAYNGENITSPLNKTNPQPGDPCHTLGTDSRNYIVEPVYCLQGNGIDRADTAGCNGKGVKEDICYTRNTIDHPAVAYGVGNGQSNQSFTEELVGALNCMHDQQAVCVFDKECYQSGMNANGGHYISEGGPAPTLRATGHPPGVSINYIVRRLTPTECARLQGFPDKWGHPDAKADLTDEEYQFWLNVRNTHAAINDKPTREYTKDQILKWYNGLHTDSSEYKMWGNGIALPNALYMMQGIADVMSEEKAARRKWLMDLLGDCV